MTDHAGRDLDAGADGPDGSDGADRPGEATGADGADGADEPDPELAAFAAFEAGELDESSRSGPTGQRDLAAFASLAGRIQAELRRLGAWHEERPPQDAFDNGGAFGMQTMAYTQWLQWVLVPRLREVADGTFPVPPTSQAGAHAVREFDGWNESAELQSLLIELDSLVARSQ